MVAVQLFDEGLGHSSYLVDLGDGSAAIIDPPPRSVGSYRLWRDAGYAVGALLAGVVADLVSIEDAIYAVAALTVASGVIVVVRMYETHPPAVRR